MKLVVEACVRRPCRAAGNPFVLDVTIACEAASLGLVGPSGSGKSTLLDAIAGIEPGARVIVDGVDWSRRPLHAREVGYVTQDALLFPHLTVRGNLLYSPRAAGLGDVPAALGIEALLDRRPRNLSGGERRRVALGRAILARPRLLLLDEPFGGLDEPRRREAMSLLDRVRCAYALPMVLVSHLADEVIGLTDHAVRLEDGRVAAAGPSPSVLRARETRIDNYLVGTAVGPSRVRVDGVDLDGSGLPDGATGDVRLACHAHDILLARDPPGRISARNVVATRVASLVAAGDAVLVEVERPRLRALLTSAAVHDLDLAPGTEVFVVIKATSLTFLGSA